MQVTLTVEARTGRGKNEARRLRRSGKLPAVVYGGEGSVGIPVSVDPKVLLEIFHSESGVNTLIGLSVDDGNASQVLVKEFQVHPVSSELLHVDFYRLALDKRITVSVPIVLKGEPLGVTQQGGLVDFIHRDVEVECMPTEIPKRIEVDISDLMIGQGVRLHEVSGDVPWSPVSDPDTLLVHVIAPKIEEEPEEEEVVEGEADSAEGGESEQAEKGKAGEGENSPES